MSLRRVLLLTTALLVFSPYSFSAEYSRVQIPLIFEPNVGQADETVHFVAHTGDATAYLSGTEARLALRGSTGLANISLRLLGSKISRAEGLDQLKSFSNYFIGSDSSAWNSRVPHYGRVRFEDVYRGVDVVYYGNEGRLEYDFLVAPGADPDQIQLQVDGADSVRVDSQGNLVMEVDGRTVRQLRPKVYQRVAGVLKEIGSSYRLQGEGRVRFALERYDSSRELIIDPIVEFATYFGGTGYDVGKSIAIDGAGAVYVAGHSNSRGFAPSGRWQTAIGGETDAVIAKFSAPGTRLEWVTYLGGRGQDAASSIAVDAQNNVIVVGSTISPDFPTRNPFQSANAGPPATDDAFVAKISPNGTELVYSTYLGGPGIDLANAVAVDASGAAYVAGWTRSSGTPDFPLQSSFQQGRAGGGPDLFVSKFGPVGGVVYSTLIGGDGQDISTGIAVDAAGNAYVTGITTSRSFPTLSPIQTANAGGQDMFVLKLAPAGNSLVYGTFIGGAGEDVASDIALDPAGNAYVTGYTASPNFPVRNAFQTALAGPTDAVVFKINAAGNSLDYSSFLGGSGDEAGFGSIAVDANGSAYVSGRTASANFPLRNAAQQRFGGPTECPAERPNCGYDAFVTRLAPLGNAIVYSTYLGGNGDEHGYGLTVNTQGVATVSGYTSSTDFPGISGGLSQEGLNNPGIDMFVARLTADTSVQFLSTSAQSLNFSVRGGQDPPAQNVNVTSTGAPIAFTAGSNVPWLRVVTSGATTPATLTVSVTAAGLPSRPQTAEITINAPSAENRLPTRIGVMVDVAAVPVISSLSPTILPRGQETRVTITGSGFLNTSQVLAGPQLLQSTFVNATTLQVVVPASVASGASPVALTVRNPDGVTTAVFELPISSSNPAIANGGIVSSASQQGGFVSPGELITIFGANFGGDRTVNASPDASGTLPTSLAETRVLFDGVAAPILSVGNGQTNVVVPTSVAGRGSTNVEVEFRGQRSSVTNVGVGPATPGLFTENRSGTGQAAALNPELSANSAGNPVARGSIIVLYATGVGLMNPSLPDGTIVSNAFGTLPTPVVPVMVRIGDQPAEVVHAGAAAGFVYGVAQINVRVPESVPEGSAVPVVIAVGSASSRTGVTIAVR